MNSGACPVKRDRDIVRRVFQVPFNPRFLAWILGIPRYRGIFQTLPCLIAPLIRFWRTRCPNLVRAFQPSVWSKTLTLDTEISSNNAA
jgi:hypothetical protein